jgi:hypothetical protein
MNRRNHVKAWPPIVVARTKFLKLELSIVGLVEKVKTVPKRLKGLAITADNRKYFFYMESLNELC